jgi:hypothetical protein
LFRRQYVEEEEEEEQEEEDVNLSLRQLVECEI